VCGGPVSRWWKRPRALSFFRRDASGTTAVEFGLLSVPFMLTLLGIFEVGYTVFMMSALDAAARVSARAVMTGAVSTAGMTPSSFRTNVVCPRLPANFDCTKVFVNMTIVPSGQSPTGYYSYVNSAQNALTVPPLDASANSFCPGSGGQYVVVQVLYPASYFTMLFAGRSTATFQGKQVNVLMSTATFKAEPYGGGAAYAGC
jgi:Flp pilus assembly protein TadG